MLLQRDREVREAFNDMVSRVRKVLEGLPEDLQEEGNEQKAVDVWDLMTWLKGKCSTILEVLEVTRDKYLGTEVVNGDVSEILADIVQRARQEAVGDIRTLHVEAACIFIHAARRIEELLQPIVLPRLVSGTWAVQNHFHQCCLLGVEQFPSVNGLTDACRLCLGARMGPLYDTCFAMPQVYIPRPLSFTCSCILLRR